MAAPDAAAAALAVGLAILREHLGKFIRSVCRIREIAARLYSSCANLLHLRATGHFIVAVKSDSRPAVCYDSILIHTTTVRC